MKRFSTEEEYDQWVNKLVRNNRNLDGSSWEHVAQIAITSTFETGEGLALRFNGDPYTEVRTTPTEVLTQKLPREPAPEADTYREQAVYTLAEDLREAAQDVPDSRI